MSTKCVSASIEIPLPVFVTPRNVFLPWGQAIRENPAFIKLRRIDAAKEIASVVSASGQKVYLSADSLLLNLGDEAKPDPKGRK
jgi:hypothetical protein